MKKALILCNDFPPLNSIGAERPYSWLLYFKKYGIDVTVITKNWTTASPSIADLYYDIPGSVPVNEEITEEGRVLHVPHHLTAPDNIVLQYGTQKRIFLRKVLTLIYKALSFISFYFDKHRNIYHTADSILKKEKFDYLITTGEPFVLFRYGFLLKMKYELTWIADYRDGWYLNHETSKQASIIIKLLRRFELLFEYCFLKKVDMIQSVDPILTNKLSEMHGGKKSFCVYNGFREFYQPKQVATTQQALTITHTGTLTTGQRVEWLLEAVLQLHRELKIKPGDLRIQMVGLQFYEKQCNRVLNYSSELLPYLVTTPRLSRSEALKMNYESDYCISLTDPDYSAIYAKTYDYIACSTPILLIPNDHSLLEKVLKQLQAGVAIESLEQLKDFLLENIEKKKSVDAVRKISIDREKARFYSREFQTQKMAEKLLDL